MVSQYFLASDRALLGLLGIHDYGIVDCYAPCAKECVVDNVKADVVPMTLYICARAPEIRFLMWKVYIAALIRIAWKIAPG
jgi:hypothetical protein